MKTIAFFDLETNQKSRNIQDIGGIRTDGAIFHENSLAKFQEFICESDFVCGHNIIRHDLVCLQAIRNHSFSSLKAIDTLFLSPLLFPSHPYHRLLKDDKLQTEELNNPLNDSIKARDLFYDEVAAFHKLSDPLKQIFFNLLYPQAEFCSFFDYIEYAHPLSPDVLVGLIWSTFEHKICQNANLSSLITNSPISLAYCLALINITDRYSITPPWVLHNFSDTDRVMFLLRNQPCVTGCSYCDEALDPIKALKRHFGYPSFRSYDGKPLQENAVRSAIQNKSLLAVFPTGGGKSITFQIPALMSGENAKALTVVISPLQSLMKDQVDNLEKKGITDAVTINGMLDPIERQNAIERVAGTKKDTAVANLLYLSPESLRSVTIERLLLGRKIARFVIDEAHCFSSWGQDFRVDYLYIGDFIKNLQEKKGLTEKIPVSCFTATAKQKVIEDIRTYFKEKLDLELEIFRANQSRTNLQYKVFNKEGEEDKYAEVRRLLETKNCPTIIYVSRTKRAYQLATRLTEDGFNARPYHGKMDKEEKIQNQNAFIAGEVPIMVATSAFGMGVDKDNVGMVIHYEISDSLENYVQEAGRAGRNEAITADCYVLFNEEDLDQHFNLLNQTKLDIKEINQIWKAIKELTRTRERVTNSALEIARKAGWDDGIAEIETRVTTAIAALEDAGYLQRGQNMPRVFANSILSKTAQEAIEKISSSEKFTSEKDREKAIRIIKKLFSSKSKRLSTEEEAESRVDYISDHLGIQREEVIRIIALMQEEKILAHTKDLTAFIRKGENSNRSVVIVDRYRRLEEFFFSVLSEGEATYNLKELNELAEAKGCKDTTPNKLKTIINFWSIKNWIKKHSQEHSKNHLAIALCQSKEAMKQKMERRHELAHFIVDYLYRKVSQLGSIKPEVEEVLIEFSVLELKEAVASGGGLFTLNITNEDVEDTLFYLSRIEAIKIEGGFLVVYNRLVIDRLQRDNRIQYKLADYQKLAQFYQSKVQQIHIVGEYAKKMVYNYSEALQFVDDYFRLNYASFLNKYFPGSRQEDIRRTLTPEKFRQLFVNNLSVNQLEIIKDNKNQHIVVAAGPGSGKTKVLVHKLASLLLTEDVKHEQLLMLTFSRAAATEFKKRLLELINKTAHFVEIKTFHSFCFDLLGRVGSLSQADAVIPLAVEKIKNGDIEASRITKAVLVVDEAQDMDEHEYELVQALMQQNEEMRVILVGDDDQNIYSFRGADSRYMQSLIDAGAVKYELTENYRSMANIVEVANQWVRTIPNRLKTLPIVPHKHEDGAIKIVQYTSTHLIRPLVEDIATADLAGTTCVLTKTNDEALHIAGLLNRRGFKARLIQSNEGFNLYNLKELRYFTGLVNLQEESPVISEEEWNRARAELRNFFACSNKLESCLAMIDDFARINPERKYKSDWKTFLMESKLEDFLRIHSDTIYVSTIHKAKGKEFDNVFLMLNGVDSRSEAFRRELYVAITRAKNELNIHYNGSYLQDFVANNLTYTSDRGHYTLPPYLTYVLSHKDVQLGYFSFVQKRMVGLMSGQELVVGGEGMCNLKGELVLKFSRSFRTLLDRHIANGYNLSCGNIHYFVYWKDENMEGEVEIILPELELSRPL